MLEQDGGELTRNFGIGHETLRDLKSNWVLEADADEEFHFERPNLLENVRLKFMEYTGEELQHFLLSSVVSHAVRPQCKALE